MSWSRTCTTYGSWGTLWSLCEATVSSLPQSVTEERTKKLKHHKYWHHLESQHKLKSSSSSKLHSLIPSFICKRASLLSYTWRLSCCRTRSSWSFGCILYFTLQLAAANNMVHTFSHTEPLQCSADGIWEACKHVDEFLAALMPDYFTKSTFLQGHGEPGSIRIVKTGPGIDLHPAVHFDVTRLTTN